jgi:hypothetical protein
VALASESDGSFGRNKHVCSMLVFEVSVIYKIKFNHKHFNQRKKPLVLRSDADEIRRRHQQIK